MGTELKFGIPDLELPRLSGGKVSPAAFAGHALVVLFCPRGEAAEAEALDMYASTACELSAYDAWLLTIVDQDGISPSQQKCPYAIVYDPEGTAWEAFAKVAERDLNLNRDQGATFLFARGGSLHRTWPGVAPPEFVLRALEHRAG
jgi:hypothetical protein